MAIEHKHPSTWEEPDLQELCDEQRGETQSLEFKRELHLATDAQKNEAERDAHGMGNGGGGVIVYGIGEVELPDGSRVASNLSPLTDGGLTDQLQALLDDRGEPRLLFDLYEVRANAGGFYLMLDVHGRRRPHMASDGRYWGRRGTRKRKMSAAEVEEAYRERFIREHRAMEPLVAPGGGDDLPSDVIERIHRGLRPEELALWREETDETDPPGWMSVVVIPDPPRRRLLDPIKDARRFSGAIDIPERWDRDHKPLQYFSLQPTVEGAYSQLPPRDDAAPSYLVSMFRDGVMEYGSTLEPALRSERPEENRIIFSLTHPAMAHDYLQAFAVALGELGYEGDVAAQVTFEHTRGVTLGLGPREVAFNLHPIKEDRIPGERWKFSREQLVEQAGRVVKEVMDRVAVASGLDNGFWYIDDEGNLVEQ